MKKTYRIAEYKPHKGQEEFHKICESNSKEVVLISPIRSGKTMSLIYEIIKDSWNAKMPSDTCNLVLAPTTDMVYNLLFLPIADKITNLGLAKEVIYSPGRLSITLKNNNNIKFKTLDKTAFDHIRGMNVLNAYIDECAMVSKEAIDVIRGRLLTHNGRLVLASTPRGMGNWLYEDYFSSEKADTSYIKYSLLQNPIITEEAVERLRENYDPLLARQELDAEFVNLTFEQVYHAFSDANIIDSYQFNPTQPVYVGVDYNIDINAHVFMQWDRFENKVYVFDESIGCKTTQDLADHILQYVNKTPQLICIDDASGNARQQGDGITNRSILRQKGLTVAGASSNPNRLKRYAVTNAGFLNANRKHSLFISKNCKSLIKELRELTYKKTSDEINDLNNKVGHLCDSLSYAVFYIWAGKIPQDVEKSFNGMQGR